MSGRSPLLYCTLTLIAMQGHQKNSKKQRQCSTPSNMVVIIYYYIDCKHKTTTGSCFVTFSVLVANPKNYFTRWPILLYSVQYNTVQCVCVCFLTIHSGHQVRWTYQLGPHWRKVTQDFLSALLLRYVS